MLVEMVLFFISYKNKSWIWFRFFYFRFYQFFVTEQIIALSLHDASHKDWGSDSDLPCCAVAGVIKQCCFNSTPDPFNGQTANFTLKPPKVIESTTYVKKANLECYWNNTVLLLWRQHNRASLMARLSFNFKQLYIAQRGEVLSKGL